MIETKEQLIVDIDLKESDFQRANFWFRFGKWSKRLPFLLMPMFGLFLLWSITLSTVFTNPAAATAMVVLIVFPVLYPILTWFQTKQGFGNLQEFQTQVQYIFSLDGYRVADIKTSSIVSWDSILRAAESKHSFHLFFHKSLFHTIPKRCFRHPDDIQHLRLLLKQALGARAIVFNLR